MAFLRINGYAVDAIIDGFAMDDVSIENYDRTAGMQLEGLTYATKKEIKFTTNWVSASVAFALESWIRGRSHIWTAHTGTGSSVAWSSMAVDSSIAIVGSGITLATLPLYGSYSYYIPTNDSASVTVAFGTEGDFTIGMYTRKFSIGSYQWCAFVKKGSSTLSWTGGASVASLLCLAVSSTQGFTSFTIYGKHISTGLGQNTQYGAIFASPFAWTTEMLDSLASSYYACPTTGWCRPPYVLVTGEALQTNNNTVNQYNEYGGVPFKGFVESIESQPVYVASAGFQYNARRLRVKLTER